MTPRLDPAQRGSPKSGWLHVIDTDGSVGPRRTFARVDEGIPDGLAVSEDGAVWVAAAPRPRS